MKSLITAILLIAAICMVSASDLRFPDYRDIKQASPADLEQLVNGASYIMHSSEKTDEFIRNRNVYDKDTLREYLARTTTNRIYGVTINNQQFPLVGTNPLYHYCGQKFTYDIKSWYNYRLTGILIPLAINVQAGTYSDTCEVFVLPTDVQGIPQGNAFAQGKLQLNLADSSSAEPLYNFLTLDSTGIVPNYFTAFIQTRNLVDAETDFIGIWANNQGDGKAESRASLIFYNSQSQQWMIANFSDLNIDMGGGLPPDFDILLLPVIEKEMTQAVDEPVTINGITLNSIYPNPLRDDGSISLRVDVPAELRIDILNIDGSLVRNLTNDKYSAGEHTLTFNTDGIASGTYLVSIRNGNNGFAVKISIVK